MADTGFFDVAVGFYRLSGQAIFHALALRWNGRTWSQVTVPTPAGDDTRLPAVTTVTPANNWAVGSDASHSLIEHQNNTSSWSLVPSPASEPAGSELDAIRPHRRSPPPSAAAPPPAADCRRDPGRSLPRRTRTGCPAGPQRPRCRLPPRADAQAARPDPGPGRSSDGHQPGPRLPDGTRRHPGNAGRVHRRLRHRYRRLEPSRSLSSRGIRRSSITARPEIRISVASRESQGDAEGGPFSGSDSPPAKAAR